jgi:GDP-4-dehydro-6-deoxy-D-mannose reductase
MSTAVVTGGAGFVGGHLVALLRSQGWDVIGVGRTNRPPASDARFVQMDLSAPDTVERLTSLIADSRPDVVFHLAASTRLATDVERLVADSVLATAAVCGAVRRAEARVRVVLAGSSAQYGDLPVDQNPVDEDAACRPVTAYGFAKLAGESVARALAAGADIDVVPVRAFNHIGPGEPERTVGGALARRVAALKAGRIDRLPVADLEAVRDFTDVRDIARGYLAVAERGRTGRVYNLCSGRATSVRDVLDSLLRAAGLDWSSVDSQPATGRGISYQIGLPRRIQAETGWSASVPLDSSTGDLLSSILDDESRPSVTAHD